MLDDSARFKMMAAKLSEQVALGHVSNSWDEDFICSIHDKTVRGLPLSQKQREKLEELFDRY